MKAPNAVRMVFVTCLVGWIALPNASADWTHWRGPLQTGASLETGLIDTWSPEGENLVWKADFVGRSTPIVQNGRV